MLKDKLYNKFRRPLASVLAVVMTLSTIEISAPIPAYAANVGGGGNLLVV